MPTIVERARKFAEQAHTGMGQVMGLPKEHHSEAVAIASQGNPVRFRTTTPPNSDGTLKATDYNGKTNIPIYHVHERSVCSITVSSRRHFLVPKEVSPKKEAVTYFSGIFQATAI